MYQLTEKGIQVTNVETGVQQEFEPPKKFPELSRGSGIAYDSKRDLVAIVSFLPGYFYRFDPKKRRWLDVRPTSNFDITSLTYDSATDRYIAWANDIAAGDGGAGTVLVISGTGKLTKSELVADKLPGFFRLFDSG